MMTTQRQPAAQPLAMPIWTLASAAILASDSPARLLRRCMDDVYTRCPLGADQRGRNERIVGFGIR
jgi:hypothetical protein